MGILVESITKRFRAARCEAAGLLAVDDVTFSVPRGHLVALLGPSGSGKSTILRIIAGLEEPDVGRVSLDGQVMTGRPVHERGVGFVFQHYALFKHATVEKNIAFGLEVRKWAKPKIRARVSELLDLVQLRGYGNRYPSQLSGGQRQRVALARALAPRPKVLLLDEPFGALDAKVRRNLATQLRQLHSEFRTTTVFVTHDQEEAIEISDQIVVINRGSVEQMGSADQIYDHPKSKFVASFIGNVNVIECRVERHALCIGPKRAPVPGVHTSLPDGEVVLLVRPEDVELKEKIQVGDLEGVVREVRYRGDRYEQDIELAGQVIRVVELKSRGSAVVRKPGQRVAVRFMRHRVFEVEEDHAAIRSQLESLGYIE